MMPTDVVLGRRHHKKREKLKICAAGGDQTGFKKIKNLQFLRPQRRSAFLFKIINI